MKEGEEKNIDRKFREGLTNPEDNIVYNDADWDAMEVLLNEQKKRKGIIYRLPFMLGAAAAILLLALALFFFWPDDNKHGNLTGVKKRPQTDSITSVKTIDKLQQKEEIAKEELPETTVDVDSAHTKVSRNQREQLRAVQTNKIRTEAIAATAGVKKVKRSASNLTFFDDINSIDDSKNLTVVSPKSTTGSISETIASAETDSNKIKALSQQILAAVSNTQNITVQKTDTPAQAFVVPHVKEKKKPSEEIIGAKHPIVLSIIAAPDFNGVGSAFSRTQIGTNAGLLLSVGITRKLFITTGAVYARKPYMVGMDKYKTSFTFGTQPNDVSADCRVLDIPLNIDYQLYNKGRNLLSIGTGLSSYFMLRENYHFNYNQYYVGPSDYNIRNQNKHILGVVNLNATYQRRINSQFGFNVQPYMKLPITNIGYGQVNLKSTGVAIGASWYLNTSASKK
ncbi:hypothetical protein [Mucilaginibacter terrae]|uniref:Outer membrane protein beta-barrel domain-containing protein n=1 Tax=Mucilaginibacter terrae TaxID=1955052 RepID=A0ABU3H0H6_9SPHI|nr:hypothetical protein [Mucilaginibacter terrae]MDT3405528.1 hypothetical protein [Mucilaginibacter terrae]